MKVNFKGLISFFAIIFLWYFLTKIGIYSTYLLPTFPMIWESFFQMLKDGSLFVHVSTSLTRVFIGYFIAFFLAFFLSIASLIFKSFDKYFDWLIQFLRNVLPLSLIPLLILWFGIGEKTKIIIIILASFFPMYLNINKGFKMTDVKLIEVGKAFNFSKLKLFFKIRLPYALNDILVGMRIGLGYSYRAIIGAEMIASSTGLGYMINFARSLSQTDVVIVGIIIIGLLGYLCDYLFKKMSKLLLKGREIYE